jgi:PBP1b-binding outer membrane lipoprotein LpoB
MKNIFLLLILGILLLSITGCCNRRQPMKKRSKKKVEKSYLSNLYNAKSFDLDWMQDKNNLFINWKSWKSRFEYLSERSKKYESYAEKEREKLRSDPDFVKVLSYFENGKYAQSYKLMKENMVKVSSNPYAKEIFKKIEVAYFSKKTFFDKDVNRASYCLVNKQFNRAKNYLRKVRQKAKSNPFMLSEYYKLGSVLYALQKNKVYSDKFYQKYKNTLRVLRRKYGE